MAEEMNRAAHRAAGLVRVNVKVTNRTDVVPMEHVETFFRYEIASEGKWSATRMSDALSDRWARNPLSTRVHRSASL